MRSEFTFGLVHQNAILTMKIKDKSCFLHKTAIKIGRHGKENWV